MVQFCINIGLHMLLFLVKVCQRFVQFSVNVKKKKGPVYLRYMEKF